jgi:hypothetical protein
MASTLHCGVAAKVICAPEPWTDDRPSVFLAGSIEMGTAAPWQDRMIAALADRPIAILNPRRPDWDASWRQSIDDPKFREQVEWELHGLERSSVVAMYFDPATRSPVTLIELGLTAASGRLIVGCPHGFWRRGNLEVVCARHGVALHDDLDALIGAVDARLASATGASS